MDNVDLVGVLLVMAGFFTVVELRISRKNGDSNLRKFAATVPAPLTDDVRAWLEPQLVRRSSCAGNGVTWGLTLAGLLLLQGWQDMPWMWFALALGLSVGMAAGALLAGYRTTPLLDGSVRTVDPVRRRVADHFGSARVVRLRLAGVVSGAALALSVVIATSNDAGSARRAVLGCGLSAALVAAHYWVTAAVIARPMVASTADGLLWQKALLAKTLEPMPASALQVATISAAIALYTSFAAYQDLPLPVLLLSGCFALLAVSAVTFTMVDHFRNLERSPWRLTSEHPAS